MLSIIELAQLLTGALDEKFNVSRTFYEQNDEKFTVEQSEVKMSEENKWNEIKSKRMKL